MLEQKVYSGYWWLPDVPENKVPGDVTIDDDQNVTLSTLGSLVEMPLSINNDVERNITGVTQDGFVTLLDCSCNNTTMSFLGIEKQNYRARVLAVGVRLEESQSLLLKSLSFKCTHLEEWVGRDNL
jgi:hypothetical protein